MPNLKYLLATSAITLAGLSLQAKPQTTPISLTELLLLQSQLIREKECLQPGTSRWYKLESYINWYDAQIHRVTQG